MSDDTDPRPEPPSTELAPTRSVLAWRDAKATPAWAFAGAAAGNRWETSAQVQPTEITESDYDAALERAVGRQ